MATRLRDQVYGCVFGGALGDALGLYTEMIGKEQAGSMWSQLGGLTFEGWTDRPHISQFQRGDWTDDTDLAVTIVESMLENGGQVHLTDMQLRAQKWLREGYPELGDTYGVGTGSTITTSLSDPTVSLGPHTSALLTWCELGHFDLGTSGSVMRISPLALFLYRDQERLIQAAVDVGALTHADPRCVAACVSVVVAIASLLQGKTPSEAAVLAEEIGAASLQSYTNSLPQTIQNSVEILTKNGYAERANRLLEEFQSEYPSIQNRSDPVTFHACFHHSQLSTVPNICDFSRDYAYKILSIAMWALRQERSYEAVVEEIVREGGDADTNAAVAGAVVGAKVGFGQLPERLVAGLVHRDWLSQKAGSVVQLLSPS